MTYIDQTVRLHVLFRFINLLLLHLKDDLEQVPHGHDHLARRLLSLDPEEPVSILRRAVHVTKCSVVRHVLSYETDFVNWMMIKTILIIEIKVLYRN